MTSARQVFALIIAINEYKSPDIPNLMGAVNDAYFMKSYVTVDLQAPESHIIFLSNESATRSAIFSAFNTLIADSRIKDDDVIVIFYAGHGSRTKAPDGWIANNHDGQIETLLPHDVDGDLIHSIPDCSVKALLRSLANAKGNNITVIFDCCHSGGLARNAGPETQPMARSVTLPYVMPGTLDNDILSLEHARSARPNHDEFRFDAMSSHVLLAACRENQSAYESTSDEGFVCGFFTQTLIRHLRHIKTHRTTYSTLMNCLVNTHSKQGRAQAQTPQCEGTHKDRAVFNGQLVGKLKAFTLSRNEENKTFEVGAGYSQGVVPGTEFVVQNKKPESYSWEDLGFLKATTVDDSSSTLVPRDSDFHVPEEAIALVSNWKYELKVFVHPDSEEQETLESGTCPAQYGQAAHIQGAFVVCSQPEAHVVIKLQSCGQNRKLHIERRDGLMSRYASHLSIALPSKLTLPLILDPIAHFNYHLGRHHGEGPLQTVVRDVHDPLRNVSMELFRLTTKKFLVPDTTVGNLLINNEAKLELDENAVYGVEITNNTEYDLFPYLFYFDPSDYSIQLWYSPPSLTMDPPLQGLEGRDPGRVTVGYGAGGGDPFQFTLEGREQSDTGFLKLFVSTGAVNMSTIAQDSPFENKSGTGRAAVRKRRFDVIWGTVVAAVTVSR